MEFAESRGLEKHPLILLSKFSSRFHKEEFNDSDLLLTT